MSRVTRWISEAVAVFVLAAIFRWLLTKLPSKLVENAVIGFIDDEIGRFFGITAPKIFSFIWEWAPPLVAAMLVLILYHVVNRRWLAPSPSQASRLTGKPTATSPFRVALSDNASQIGAYVPVVAISITNTSGADMNSCCLVELNEFSGNWPKKMAKPLPLRTEGQIRRQQRGGRFTLSKGQSKTVPLLFRDPVRKTEWYFFDEQGDKHMIPAGPEKLLLRAYGGTEPWTGLVFVDADAGYNPHPQLETVTDDFHLGGGEHKSAPFVQPESGVILKPEPPVLWDDTVSELRTRYMGRPPEPDDDRGFLDYSADGFQALQDITRLVTVSSTETERLTEFMARVTSMAISGGDVVGRRDDVSALAEFMNGYSTKMEEMAALVRAITTSMRDNQTKFVEHSTITHDVDYEAMRVYVQAMRGNSAASGRTVEMTSEFRKTTEGLKGISRALTKASTRLSVVLGIVSKEFENYRDVTAALAALCSQKLATAEGDHGSKK